MKFKFLLFLFIFLIIESVSAVEISLNYSTSSIVQLKSLKYEPYPVNPGEYFDFYVNVQYTQSTGTGGSVFELIPTYPFSLDPNETAVREYGFANSPSIVLHYKIRVDKDAFEGVNQLKLNYKIGTNWYSKFFDIEVANAQTDFDAVIQDSTSSEVSIAIANIGKNTANSVIVKIPEQDNFMITGTDGQMIGNLESGDYSIVSFEISKKMSQILQDTDENKDNEKTFREMQTSQSENLTFNIYYTDNIGVRRIVSMQLPVSLSNSNISATGMMGPGRRGSFSIPWYIILIIFAVLLTTLFIIYKKFPEQTKKLFNKLNLKKWSEKKEKKDSDIPDWVKKTKDREKNK